MFNFKFDKIMKKKISTLLFSWVFGLSLIIPTVTILAQDASSNDTEFLVIEDERNRFFSWFGCKEDPTATCVIRANKETPITISP